MLGGEVSIPNGLVHGVDVAAIHHRMQQRVQVLLDRATPHIGRRWAGWAACALLYVTRVALLRGFYIVSYALAIYNLNLLLGFLTPAWESREGEPPGRPPAR
ncbi:hypothetical protein FOA52_016256 [Chlamydomonas sp. UWO 241]|nr:hypothetical protein FOA52_016256 [Chlamydomonas sp. UWO 241]